MYWASQWSHSMFLFTLLLPSTRPLLDMIFVCSTYKQENRKLCLYSCPLSVAFMSSHVMLICSRCAKRRQFNFSSHFRIKTDHLSQIYWCDVKDFTIIYTHPENLSDNISKIFDLPRPMTQLPIKVRIWSKKMYIHRRPNYQPIYDSSKF